MRSILGKFILAPALLAAAALATSSAKAETNIKVPFSFVAAGTTWPAGDYSVKKDLNGSVVTVTSKQTALSFTTVLGPGEPGPTDTHVSLKFDASDTTHVLRSIQVGPQITSRLDRDAVRSERLTSSGR
jgi:hypothetical protein